VTDKVLNGLNAVHTHKDTQQPPAAEEWPVQITSRVWDKVLDKAPRGSAAGPSGWTYEQGKAAGMATQKAVIAVLELMPAMVQGKEPHVPAQLQSTLLPIAKPGGGIRPIAKVEVRYRLAGLCVRATTRAKALLPCSLLWPSQAGHKTLGAKKQQQQAPLLSGAA
jgi:hypothetical protein